MYLIVHLAINCDFAACTILALQAFLGELHKTGKLSSISMWKELFSTIAEDERYLAMLGQPGTGCQLDGTAPPDIKCTHASPGCTCTVRVHGAH